MIKPVDVTTSDVTKELQLVAKKEVIPISKLYLQINSVETMVKSADSKFFEMEKSDIAEYNQEIYLRDSAIKFKQQYDITIKSIPTDYQLKNLTTEIEFTDNNSCAYLVIKKGSKLNYYSELYHDFLSYISEQKLRSNIMLYLFNVEYKESIRNLIDVIKQIKTLTFKEDKKILISKGFDEIISMESNTKMTIEDENSANDEDSEGRVDYANRGFLISCVEGDELFDFTKPHQGQHGRTVMGNIIEVEIIHIDLEPIFTVEDSIEVQDSFENIKYLSTKSGYLIKKGNQYEVSNNIDIDEISFKTTGTIDSDLDSEISINVIKDNPLEDAIEEGMHVKVQTLSITGSIGRHTTIEARDISISGQSHSDSSIKCMNAKIGVHKGKITGRTVEVSRLEGGEVIAETAIIANAISGKIRAKTIKIEVLGSHIVMEASQYIEIHKVKGEENKFIFDSSIGSAFSNKDKDDNDEVYLEKLKSELGPLMKKFKEVTLKLKNNLKPCEKIRETIIKNQKKGLEISATLIKNFKICKIMKVQYKKLKEDVVYKKDQYDKLEIKLSGDKFNILDAEVIVDKPLKGFNHIVYKLQNPIREIELNTHDDMNKKIFKLSEDEDGVLKIINTD